MRKLLALAVLFWAAGCSSPVANVRPTSTAFEPPAALSPDLGPLATLQSEMNGYSFVVPTSELEPLAAEVLVRANKVRLEHGLAALHASTPLTRVASLRAQDMVARGYFDHVDPRRGTVEADRLVRSLGVVGEIAELLFTSTDARHEVPQAALERWLADSANASTLMDGNLTYAGAGVMGDGTWWVVVLMMTEAAP
ncbi:MAG: CAP domain-containing protein [Anaerolineales bacterium]